MSQFIKCAHCGEPISRAPGAKGRAAKVHAECRAAYKAAREHARRREVDPEVGSAARRWRKLHAWDALRVKNLFLDQRGREVMGQVYDKDKKVWVSVGYGKDAPKEPRRGLPPGMAWGDNHKPVGIHFDPAPPDVIPASYWKRMAWKAAIAVSSSTADAAKSIWEVLHGQGQYAALRHLEEILAEPEIVAAESKVDALRHRLTVSLDAVGRAALTAYDKTLDARILEALTSVPGFGGGVVPESVSARD